MNPTESDDLDILHPAGLLNPINFSDEEIVPLAASSFLDDESEESYESNLPVPTEEEEGAAEFREILKREVRTLALGSHRISPSVPVPLDFEKSPLYSRKTKAIIRKTLGPALDKAKKRRERAIDKLSNAFIESLGSNSEFQTALALSDSPRAQDLLHDILTPKYRTWTVTALARKHGFSPATMFDLWRGYNTAKGMLTIASGIPEVSKGVVEDAKSIDICCPRCDGWGEIERTSKTEDSEGKPVTSVEKIPCPQCKSAGSVRKPGDSDSRKLMFEAVGFIKKQNGININIGKVGVESVLDELDSIDASPIIDITP